MESHVKITLSNGAIALVSASDADLVAQYRWRPSQSKMTCYAVTKIDGRTVYMHRLILEAKPGEYVDHKNYDGLDNRRSNIAVCTQVQNAGAMRPYRVSSTSGIRGIHKHGRKWRVMIGKATEHHSQYVGSFSTLDEAIAARASAASARWGEFARNG